MKADTKVEMDDSLELTYANVLSDEVMGLLKTSPEFLLQFFLGDQLTRKVPLFHTSILRQMVNPDLIRLILCIPRGHAKTTLAKLSVVWHWLFSLHRFAVYLSNTSTIAKNCCRDIINYIKCPNFVNVFGSAVFKKESENEGLWIFDLTLAGGEIKRCILRAVGAGQQTRGINVDNQRPDIAIVDDLEDKENTKTVISQKQLDDWMFGTFIKSLDKFKYKIIWLGNMLRKTSLLSRLSKDPSWNPIVYGCLLKDSITGKLRPLWPDLWPLDEITNDFSEYTALGLVETWMCEMMNMPGSGKDGFSASQFHYRPRPNPDSPQILSTFITVDPAFSLKDRADNTAIVVHAIMNFGPTIIVDYTCSRMTESEIFDRCLEYAHYWNCWFWGIEAVAAQTVLLTLFNLYAIREQVDSKLVFVKLRAAGHKSGRIQAWVSMMGKQASAIPEGDMLITSQLLAYDPENRDNDDDLIDACAYQCQMLDEYMTEITQNYYMNQDSGIKNFPQIRTGVQVCPY